MSRIMIGTSLIGVVCINVGAFASQAVCLVGLVLFAPTGYTALRSLATSDTHDDTRDDDDDNESYMYVWDDDAGAMTRADACVFVGR